MIRKLKKEVCKINLDLHGEGCVMRSIINCNMSKITHIKEKMGVFMSKENEVKVAILMATYNGDQFIDEQLDSILSQTYRNIEVIIRDDGSSDSTIRILEEKQKIDKRIIIIKNNSGKHGVFLNFWNLLHIAKKSANYDYYFFADQDDIWASTKIETMISFAEKKDVHNIPILIYTDMEIIDENHTVIYPSFDKKLHIGNQRPEATFFTRDIFWGCAMAINHRLLLDIPLVTLDDSRINIISHDTYIAEFAALFGNIYYIEKVLISHRQHSKNVTGESSLLYNKNTIYGKVFKSSYGDKAKKHARTYAQSLIALELFEKSGYKSDTLYDIRDAINRGGIFGVSRLIKYSVKKVQKTRMIILYVVMASKKYKEYLNYWLNYKEHTRKCV